MIDYIASKRSMPEKAGLKIWMPVSVGVAALILVLVQWQALLRQERSQIKQRTEAVVAAVRSELEDHMNNRILALVRMAKRWEIQKNPSEDAWAADAELYMQHNTGYQAIEWVDQSFNVRWIVPPLIERDKETRRDDLIRVRDKREVLVSPPLNLIDGSKGFEVYIPMVDKNELRGFIVAVFRIQELFGSILDYQNIYPKYSIAIFDEKGEYFTFNQAGEGYEKEFGREAKINLYGGAFRVRVSPTAELLAETRSSLPIVALVGGTVLSLLLSVAIYLAQDARRKEKSLEAKKDELEEEISERVRTWMELDATNRRLEKEITEHQRTEARLLESEGLLSQSNARFEAIFNSISDAVVHTDTQRRVVLINTAATRMFGYTYDEMKGKTVEFIYADKAAYEEQGMLRYQSESASDSQIFTMEYRRKDGTHFTAESLGTQVRSPNGDVLGFIGIHRDITERKRMEGLLLQSQKMEALGHLASGVAHDFNNILTAVSGYAEILSMKMDKNNPLRRYVKEIAKAGERGNKLISSLLAFARDEEFNLQPASINEIVMASKQLLLRLLTEDIELEINIKDEPLAVLADCNQIEQVLMNLVVNASDAMPGGGSLTISTELVERGDSFNKSFGDCLCEKGRYAVLTVKDTGSGMDEETKKRIFEPFFTTKEPGKGTGLGLFGAYGIIKRHGGCIEVESEAGTGTAFRIYLPVTDMHEIREETEEQVIHANGTETILIADDEREIRASASSLLEELGYHVIEAANGAEAVVKFMENKDSVRLMILDMVMPKKNGKEVFDEIKRVSPDIKAIFTSGYTEEILEGKGMLEEELNFIVKPFLPNVLLRTVRKTLDK